jgi:ATP-dependent helicase/nuclease subunit B
MTGPAESLHEPDPAVLAAAAGATVITANNRLSRLLLRRHAALMRGEGQTAWEAPDILPWGAWLRRCWEALLMQGVSGDSPAPGMLLARDQAIALWEQLIADSPPGRELLRIPAAARQAREAYQLRLAWRMDAPRDSATCGRDAGAFLDWSAHYEERCRREGWIDEAHLPDLIAARVATGQLALPPLCLAGFDEFTPQQQALIGTIEAAGVPVTIAAPRTTAGRLVRVSLEDAAGEILAAAQWARALLESRADARIGVVVPDLGERREQVARIFDDVLRPGAVLHAHSSDAPLFNLSAGAALAYCPVVHDALLALDLAGGEVTLAEAGALLRSPFISGAEQEFAARALHDVRLRDAGEIRVTIAALVTPSCPLLAGTLTRVEAAASVLRDRRLRPSDWAEHLFGLLRLLGWPGERTLDSDEYQAVEAWRDLVAGLSALDRVQAEITFALVLAQLRRASAERMFQPERPETPIQVLGLLEAGGLAFDHLWILGLHDGAWPPAPEPNPFLPIALQRRLGMPRSSPEREYAVAQSITTRLLAAAPEVCVSHPRSEGDRDLRASPLIADIPAAEWPLPGVAGAKSYDVLIHEAGRASGGLETVDDARGPALSEAQTRGGSQVFKMQSDCPFRAFAGLRLQAKPLAEAGIGLESMARGILLHQVLERLWRELGSRAALLDLGLAAIDALLARVVDAVIGEAAAERPRVFTPRFRALEREHLLRSVGQWLDFEEARGPFTVEACEHKAVVTAGDVTVEVKIDRIDRLDDGSIAIIDYKTGTVSKGQWFGARPEDPQLPLYSLQSGDALGAVLFARIRPGESGWIGVTRDEHVAPKVKAFDQTGDAVAVGGWGGLLAHWRAVLTRLGEAFRAGDAAVDPRDGGKPCAYCGLTPLCRINEATSPVAEETVRGDREAEP